MELSFCAAPITTGAPFYHVTGKIFLLKQVLFSIVISNGDTLDIVCIYNLIGEMILKDSHFLSEELVMDSTTIFIIFLLSVIFFNLLFLTFQLLKSDAPLPPIFLNIFKHNMGF